MISRRKKLATYLSPITLRILAVNIGALLILAFGLLYTGQYERELINAELKNLTASGRLLAASLAGGGARETLEGEPVLAEDLSRHMLRKLAEDNPLHTILFNKTGQLLLDSRQLQGPGGAIQMVELEAPVATWTFQQRIYHIFEKALSWLPTRLTFPAYPEKTVGIETYPHMIEALRGEISSGAWYDQDGHILLTASLPVQNLKNVMGAVMVTRSGANIEYAVRDLQFTVLKLFLWALVATIILSVYLSETIGTPILRLAEAAERVRQSLLSKDSIPDFSYRHDEIGALSTALREMTTELTDRIDTIGSFAADVAHEIKNPLASLKSAVETIVVVEDAVQQKQLLSIIEDDVNRLDRLITDISMASRLDSEISRAAKTTFDLVPLLQKIVELEGVGRIVLKIDPGLKLPVTANDTQISRVLHNLLQNAISFVRPEGNITVTGLLQGDKVVIYIDNDGPEIPERKLETIFERFYSERPETEKFGLHSGLGLSISRQIIRAHRGAIFARNLKNGKGEHRGVRFTIILPIGGAI